MIKFKYRDITIEFQSWYDAANWLYYQWVERGNERIRQMIDSSSSYVLDFTAWVNDNYTAYDILSRCRQNELLYEDLLEKYLQDLADDLEDDTYDFCVFFTEIEEEKLQPDPNVKYYKITYSCGCGENEEYITAIDYDEALLFAYESAIEDYHCYEGYHGIRTVDEIAEELFGDESDDEFIIDNLTDDQIAEAENAYEEEIESTIDYYAEEISFEEYLENR